VTRAAGARSARAEPAVRAPGPIRPLRVAHLTATFPPYLGGAGTVCWHTAAGLAERGHRVEVFTAAAGGAAPEFPAPVHRLDPVLAIGNAPLLPRLARLRGYDVVHLHYPFIFGTELVLLGRLRSREAALVVSYHNNLIGEGLRRPLFRAYEESWGRLLVRRADRICVVSDAHARTVPQLRAAARRRPETLAVVPNGVDLTAFAPGPAAGVREEYGIPAGSVLAVFVATLDRAHYFKRLDLAIEALARLGNERLHLLVAGGGEWLERYCEQAARAGLGGRVHFAGPVSHDRLPDMLRAGDFLLLASDLESFGIVLLEAMASGVPTVSTDPPGVRAVVREGTTGLLAPRGRADALAARIREIVSVGQEQRRHMGEAGRRECERKYSWPRIVDRVESLYRSLTERRPGR
jgi:glycosyltransferase involved in cell wall biosynthesis